MQETTRESVASKTEYEGLMGIINDQREELKAKQKRIKWLEWRLQQRVERTQNLYQKRREHFSRMQDLAYRIFKDNPNIPFNYEDLVEEWKLRYPNVSPINLPRRTRELAEQNLLWSVFDPESKKVYHYLRLEKLEEEEGS